MSNKFEFGNNKSIMKKRRIYMGNKKENTTKYGEEVCSEFAWLPLDKQKEKAEKFSKITKSKRKSKNK